MPKETIHLSIDSDLLGRIDQDRARSRHSRSAWVSMAAEDRLDTKETDDDEDER